MKTINAKKERVKPINVVARDEALARKGDKKAIHRLKSRAYKFGLRAAINSGLSHEAAVVAAGSAYRAEASRW